MKSRLFKILAAVIVLLGLGVLLLLWNINPILEKLRPQIVSTLSETVGQEVSIGEISADLFPSVGIRIKDVGLKDSPGDAFAETLVLDTSLFSLLKGEVEVSKLEVAGAKINVVRKKDGSLHLGSLNLSAKDATNNSETGANEDTSAASQSDQSAPQSAEKPAESTEDAESGSSLSLSLRNADISNVSVSWTDESVSPPAKVSIDDFEAKVRDVAPNSKGSVALAASVLGKSKQNFRIDGSLALGQTLTALPTLDLSVALDSLDLARLATLLASYGMKPEELELGEELSYQMGIKLDSTGIHVSPSLNATKALLAFGDVFRKAPETALTLDVEAQPSLLGAVTASKVDLNIGEIALSAPLSFSPEKGANVKLVSSAFPLKTLGSLLPPAQAFNPGGALAINLNIATPPDGKAGKPKVEGRVDLKSISALVPAAEGAPGIAISDVDGALELSGDTLTAKPLSLSVAGQKLQAGAVVKNLEQPNASLAVTADSISLGPILSGLRKKDAEASALESSTISGLKFTANHSMATRRGKINLSLGQSSLAGAPLKSLSMSADTALNKDNAPESVVMKNAKIEVFSGVITSDFTLSNADAFNGKTQLSSLQLAELSKLALGSGSVLGITGLLDSLSATFSGSLKDPAASLQASSAAQLSNGEVTGFNVLGQTLGKINKIPGVAGSLGGFIPEKYRPVIEANSTKFDAITFKGNLVSQNLNVSSFELRHTLYLLTGSGKIGLNGSMELQTQMRLTPVLAEEMILKEPKLKLLTDRNGNIVFPVVIRKSAGGLPIVLPDISSLLKGAAANTAKEAGKRALDKVAPGLGGALDSLF